MSLLVWLPLNGTLNNQGTNDMQFSYINNNGKLSVNSTGKIGKCYERTASAYADLIRSNTTVNLSEDITMMCWAYVSATIGDTANGLITNHSHADCTGVGITVKQISTSDYRISCNTGEGSGGRTYHAYYGTTNIKNAWHHLALTYSKSQSQLKLWVDGNVEYTLNSYVNVSKSDYIDLFNWSTTHYTSGDYRPVCKLNDIRVYDECLSAKEIKEISKGLVVHYKLCQNGANLMKNTYTGCVSGAGTVTHNGFGGFSYRYLKYEGTSFQECVEENQFITPTANTKYTVSFWAKGNCTINCHFYPNTCASGICSTGTTSTATDGYMPITLTNQWKKYWITWTTFSSISGAKNVIVGRIYNQGSGAECYIAGVKLELGDKPTPWCPHVEDAIYSSMGYNNVIEPDCSGFGNNGTKYGPISKLGDNARYTGSYGFDGDTTSILTPFSILINDDIFTINMWFKRNTGEWSSKTYETLFGGPSGFEIESKNSTTNSPVIVAYSWGGGSFAYDLDKWNMLTLVRTSSETKFYLNGVLKLTGGAGSIPSGDYWIGSWKISTSQNYKGKISDFRVYATALTADDVKSLYEVTTSVSKNGSLLAYDFVEEV